ncbi:MAG: hypothetical protein Q9162_005554 [Coniocarpon cinnabarinum]
MSNEYLEGDYFKVTKKAMSEHAELCVTIVIHPVFRIYTGYATFHGTKIVQFSQHEVSRNRMSEYATFKDVTHGSDGLTMGVFRNRHEPTDIRVTPLKGDSNENPFTLEFQNLDGWHRWSHKYDAGCQIYGFSKADKTVELWDHGHPEKDFEAKLVPHEPDTKVVKKFEFTVKPDAERLLFLWILYIVMAFVGRPESSTAELTAYQQSNQER